MFDLCVVGGGPVGCKLAQHVSDNGFEVSVLEKNVVGEPLACSGHVSGDIWEFLPSNAEDELKQNEIHGARFHVGNRVYEFYKDETVSWVIDRIGMDRMIAEQARDSGAEIVEGCEVREINQVDAGYELETNQGSIEARFIGGCDGPRSVVRRRLGFEEPDVILKAVLGFSDEVDHGDFVDVYLDIPGFFGWRIPRGDAGVEYGAGAKQDPMKWMKKIVLSDWPDVDISGVCAGQIPIGPVEPAVRDQAFLVGDAAGQVKPYTGGGLVYGMRCAGLAAECLDPANPTALMRYESKWRGELARDIWLGRYIRGMYAWPGWLQRLGLGLFEGEIYVHMDRPTSLFNRKTASKVLRNALPLG